MRPRHLLAAVVLLAVGCSDSPRVTESSGLSATRQVVAPVGTLEQNIYGLFALYPKGISTAGLNRWTTLKRAYQAGLSNPSKMPLAYDQLVRLAEWVQDMAPRMSDPPGAETRADASLRLTLYMSLYVYNGPSAPIPPYVAGGDNAIGIVTPDAGQTIVTPSTRAGVSLEAGAVDVETIILITENPTPYPTNCSGPLPTKVCQYPTFYHFSQFPHVRLNIGAKFAVCHVNNGVNRLPLRDHDSLRLAHNLPATPAGYTPGSTIRSSGGEAIEILPLISQTFSVCDDIEYALNEPTGLMGVLARAGAAIEKALTPKSAFAIDQGGGGMSYEFSDFNNVDPGGQPDDSVHSVSAMSVAGPTADILPGGEVALSYIVTNKGTATSPNILGAITLKPNVTSSAPPTDTLTTFGLAPLAPGQSMTLTTTAFIPSGTPWGSYTLGVVFGSDPLLPDLQMLDNAGSATIYVGSTAILRVAPVKRISRP